MEPIDRILACSARVFGLAPFRRRGASLGEGALRPDIDGIEPDALECCAAEGLAAERLVREAHDGAMR
ncbi:MAG: hypothetical protein ROZ64_04785 [Burkholderiaceae bacterium]|jgi:hypothetical protein|nr:hypothetical protein [Burkholderiaceae bacterium]